MSSSSNHDQRTPLSNNTNSLVPSRSPSPQDAADKPAASLALRRRGSFRRLNPRADSSEDPPSVHSSIFEAPYCSSSEGGGSGEKDDAKALQAGAARDSSYGEESGSRPRDAPGTTTAGAGPGPRDRLTRLGRTPLETIIEKKSAATIRSPSLARTHSLDGSVPASSHIPVEAPPIFRARRKQSFSFDDAASLESSKKKVSDIAAGGILPPKKAYRNYAGPNMPTHSRPERMPTPPGMPSWSSSTPSTAPGRALDASPSPSPSTRRPRHRDFFFRFPIGTPSSSEHTAPQTPNSIQVTDQRRFVTVPNGRPCFRPPPSGHRSYGSLDMHPFHGAPIAKPWESSSGRPPYLRPRGNSAVRMQYMRPVREEATGAASARPMPTCPHATKMNNQSITNQGPNTPTNRPANRNTAQQTPTEGRAKKCWRCRLSRWIEKFPLSPCCGSVRGHSEGSSYRNFSTAPDNPRYNFPAI
ncbi:MAG: hypothetical protein M1840_007277 [Geoglossum simile]|nr:MAG: hypothetical protein M1840_007277 [Geoglossum simile]